MLIFNYNLVNVGSNVFFKTFIILNFLSLTGLPPFLGFFSKIILISLFMMFNSAYIYILLFIFIVILIYFYIQNLKVLLTNSSNELNMQYKNGAVSFKYLPIFIIQLIIFILVFGGVWVDDLFIMLSFISS